LSMETSDGTPLFNVLTCIVPATTTTTTTTTTTQSSVTEPTATNPTGAPPQTKFAKLNVNTALLPALYCVFAYAEFQASQSQQNSQNVAVASDPDSLALQDAEYVISTREEYPVTATNSLQLANISWLMDIIDPAVLAQAGPYLTGTSTVYSADIVTVSQDGRAFKRVKIVVDASAMYAAQVADANAYLSGSTETGISTLGGTSSGTAFSTGPVVVYRRDLTEAGWPMDPEIRRALRRGELPQQAVTNSGTAASGSRLTFGP
jgi:hypothetical protein